MILYSTALYVGGKTDERRYPWHLNERFITLLLGNMAFFAFVSVSDLITADLRAVWPTNKVPLYSAVTKAIDKGLGDMLEFSNIPSARNPAELVVIPILYYTVYYCLRGWVWCFLYKFLYLRYVRPSTRDTN